MPSKYVNRYYVPPKKKRPIPGTYYLADGNETLTSIEIAAYGSQRNILEIYNKAALDASSDTGLDGRIQPFAATSLYIPEKHIAQPPSSTVALGLDRDKITVIIAGRVIDYSEAYVLISMDKMVDACSVQFLWTPGRDENLDAIMIPYKYQDARVYIGDQKLLTGYLYGIQTESTGDSISVSLTIYSKAADVLDSTIPTLQAAVDEVNLQDRIYSLVRPFGINVIANYPNADEVEVNAKFDRTTGDKEETIGNHIMTLCRQRGMLVRSNGDGDLVLERADENAPSFGVISSVSSNYVKAKAKYDGRKMFGGIQVVGSTPSDPTNIKEIKNTDIPRLRTKTFKETNINKGNIEGYANWEMAKQYADALSLNIPVVGWYAETQKIGGSEYDLWTPNTKTEVNIPSMLLGDIRSYLIQSVKFIHTSKGRTAELSLVPPFAYSAQPQEITK